MPLDLDDFLDSWVVKGGGTPIVDLADGGRDLVLTGSGTAPRASSYKRRRGAEFRAATFTATAPRSFATPGSDGLNTDLYVSSKIQNFTVAGWVRPNKSGVSSFGLTPIGGLYSATNMGATPWIYDQPCLIFMDGAAGSGYVIVSCFGSILDTRTATQTKGPTSTTPLGDGEYSFVGVRVTGNATTSNQVDAVELYCRTQDGVVRVYALGEHKASAAILMGSTNPVAGKQVVIQSRAYTWRSALTGTPASTTFVYSGSGNATDGQTLTIGQDAGGTPIVYTFRAYIGAGKPATTVIEGNSAASVVAGLAGTQMMLGGWAVYPLWGAKNVAGAGAGSYSVGKGVIPNNFTSAVFSAWHGDYDGGYFTQPASPAAGTYDAGLAWPARNIVPGTETALDSGYTALSYQVPIRTLASGVAGNAAQANVYEQDAAGAYVLPVDAARSGRNSPWLLRVKASGVACASADDGAGNVDVGDHLYSVMFVDASGRHSPPTTPKSHTVASTAKKIALSAIPLGPSGTASRDIYRTKVGGTTYYYLGSIANNTGTTYSDDATDASLSATVMPTTTYFSGGAASADAKAVIIGATWADTLANLVKAINATGTGGTEYSADITTANPSATASASGNNLVLASKYAGSAGNGKPAASTTTVLPATAFTGGVDGATADDILIGATVQLSWQNLADALNHTGTPGLQYGDPTTISAHVTAEIRTGVLVLRSKEAGATGTGRTVTTDATGATIKDEFLDKTLTALYAGVAAPPFVAGSGKRPDNADLRFVWGGLPL